MHSESVSRMAYQRIGKVKYPIKVEFTVKSVDKAIKAIMQTEEELQAKCDEFCRRMAEEGVTIAQRKILEYNARDTGFLYNSIDMKPGDVVPNGASWLVYTDCEYAEFVEFGTGTEGAKKPHPSGKGWYNQDMSNKVRNPKDPNDTRLGWFYGPTWTAGRESRPFMWDTWNALQEESTIRRIAKEVFG